jgi:hypothetical protein
MTAERKALVAYYVEGDWWVAYYVYDNLEKVQLVKLGSVRMNAVRHDPETKARFMACMQGVVDGVIAAVMDEEAGT